MTQLPRRGRWFVLGTAAVAVAASPVALARPIIAATTPQATQLVSSMSALQSALSSANPNPVPIEYRSSLHDR